MAGGVPIARLVKPMAEDHTYTEYRADPSGLRKNAAGRFIAGDFEYPTYPFRPPPELRDGKVVRYPIVIVGGGLAGLTAAVDFGVRGVPSLVLDDNNTVSLGSRSIAQGKRTLEIATRLGISERMTKKGIWWSKGNTLIRDKIFIPSISRRKAMRSTAPSCACRNITAKRSWCSARRNCPVSICAGRAASSA